MKLLTDENVPAPSVALLRTAGLDVVSVMEEHSGMADPDVIALARRLGRILVTFDRDIGERIYKNGDPPPPGVIYLRFVPLGPEATASVVRDCSRSTPPTACFSRTGTGRSAPSRCPNPAHLWLEAGVWVREGHAEAPRSYRPDLETPPPHSAGGAGAPS